MKKTNLLFVFVLVLLGVLAFARVGFAAPDKALAAPGQTFGPLEDKFVTGGTFTLESGERIDGNLYIFAGSVTLEQGSYVDGSVMLAGGNLQVNGEVDGDITAAGGLVSLGDTAVVNGDVSTAAAQLSQADGARILGDVRSGRMGPFQFDVPDRPAVPPVDVRTNPLWSGLWLLLRSFFMAALATLVVMFLPQHVDRAAQAAVSQPVISIGLGLLTVIVVPLVLVIVAITIIGIPVSLIGALLLALTWAFGMIVLGTEVGKRLGLQLKQNWALAVEAALGTFLVAFVAGSLGQVIPCVGWIIPLGVGALGLGAVLLTRYGTQVYPPYGPAGTIITRPAIPPTQETPDQPYPPDTDPER